MSGNQSKTGKTLSVGIENWEIIDNGTTVQHVDLLLENRALDGTVSLSFGSAILDGANRGQVLVAARLRMNMVIAQALRDTLDQIIKDELNPPKPEKPN
ncbi:hypothetical protein [Phaeobacter inhibens]|uniref:hypothetical protein n=1 Tax=Phaeobacter inhibens TaxID=221822 RepID=UPI000C9CEC1E|nr:hypothetical protein [Phaeobacter inhibens]AUQ64438.1 hypothetical protein PhaeoP51_03507 [Phaeobacter inhibens]